MLFVNKRDLLWVLSSTVDLVGVTDLYHGKRVAFIADAIFHELKDFPWTRNEVIESALLHDCGVSSTDMHEHLVMEMEWAYAHEHCARGERLLKSVHAFESFAKAVGMHHTRWIDSDDCADSLLGNLLFLADRLDVLCAVQSKDLLIVKDAILNRLKEFSGVLFNPVFISALETAAAHDSFWLKWSVSHTKQALGSWIAECEPQHLPYGEVKDLFRLFSYCVDGKCSCTYNHSVGVAALAVHIGALYGLERRTLEKLELAALLHDLGKLRIPDVVLHKEGQLNKEEMTMIRHHSFDTFHILSQIRGLEEIALWASQHHEKLNGTGYPDAASAQKISVEARILAVADIFQALAQDRPYRKGMTFDAIISVLENMLVLGEIDAEIVSLVKDNEQLLMKAALTDFDFDSNFQMA